METFHDSLAMCDWPAVDRAYDGLIDSCNRCHAASEHELIVVTRPVQSSPFNQRFSTNDACIPGG